MAESFGVRLRQERERRQIALACIVSTTKISLPLLEALERDDISHWPSGIFRRAFVRSYAQAIGLDPDAAVREFLTHYPDPVEAAGEVSPGAPDSSTPSVGGRPVTRLESLAREALSASVRFCRRRPVSRLGRPELLLDLTDRRQDTGQPPRAAVPALGPPPSLDPAVQPRPQQPIDLAAVAQLCTQLGRVVEFRDLPPLLDGAVKVLGAVGLVVWLSDRPGTALRPALASGYPDELITQVRSVPLDARNATAAAFREGQMRIVRANDLATGAVVVPLMTPSGCVGVFAVELRQDTENVETVGAVATIFAAQLATLIGADPPEAAIPPSDVLPFLADQQQNRMWY